jgi:hypothetical protein
MHSFYALFILLDRSMTFFNLNLTEFESNLHWPMLKSFVITYLAITNEKERSMIIPIESLNKMFLHTHKAQTHMDYHARCSTCGCDIEIKIDKTSSGYGLKGGVLYGQSHKKLAAQCPVCFDKPSAAV